MNNLNFCFVVYLILVIGTESFWFWGRRRRAPCPTITPSTIKPAVSIRCSTESSLSSPSTTTTTKSSCVKSLKCRHFSAVVDMVPEASPCMPYLNDSCVSEIGLIQFTNITRENNETLSMIVSQLDHRNCDCINRSIELFCRFLLPECSPPDQQTDMCEVETCDEPEHVFPCSEYCLSLTKNCFSERMRTRIDYFFRSFSQSVLEICTGLQNDSCWKSNEPNLECKGEVIYVEMETQAPATTNITNIIICASVIAVVLIFSVLACIWYRRRIKMNSQGQETPSDSTPLEFSHITPENEAIPSRNLEQNRTSQSKHSKNRNEEIQAAPKYVNQQTKMLEKSGYENFQSGNFAQEEDGYLVPLRNIKNQSYGHSSKSNRNVAEVDEENGCITPKTIKKQTTNMDGYEAPMKGIDVTPELDGYVQPMKFMNIRPGCNEAYVEFNCNAEECENKDHSPYAEIPI